MKITKKIFGYTSEGTEVNIFSLKNDNGVSADVINYGGIVTSLVVPDRDGISGDIVLGFDNLENYLAGHPYFGALVGRYANRIANARFELGGEVYHLAANHGNNHLHGGIRGLDKVIWDYEVLPGRDAGILRLKYFSPDGDEGYPGNLTIQTDFMLNNKNELHFNYMANTDKATPVNITHHGYFNLTGGYNSVLDHELKINGSFFTEVNDEIIPTGKLLPVEGTAMDFRKMKPVGKDITDVPGGYDHNYVLDSINEPVNLAAILYEPDHGRRMEVFTTQPGMQLYTGNFLDGTITGKGGTVYHKHWGLCLETQHFPDSPNQPSFPDAILRPGEEYSHSVIFRFSAK